MVERKEKSGLFQAMLTFSRNGREVCVMAFRPEGSGGLDIWCANRIH